MLFLVAASFWSASVFIPSAHSAPSPQPTNEVLTQWSKKVAGKLYGQVLKFTSIEEWSYRYAGYPAYPFRVARLESQWQGEANAQAQRNQQTNISAMSNPDVARSVFTALYRALNPGHENLNFDVTDSKVMLFGDLLIQAASSRDMNYLSSDGSQLGWTQYGAGDGDAAMGWRPKSRQGVADRVTDLLVSKLFAKNANESVSALREFLTQGLKKKYEEDLEATARIIQAIEQRPTLDGILAELPELVVNQNGLWVSQLPDEPMDAVAAYLQEIVVQGHEVRKVAESHRLDSARVKSLIESKVELISTLEDLKWYLCLDFPNENDQIKAFQAWYANNGRALSEQEFTDLAKSLPEVTHIPGLTPFNNNYARLYVEMLRKGVHVPWAILETAISKVPEGSSSNAWLLENLDLILSDHPTVNGLKVIRNHFGYYGQGELELAYPKLLAKLNTEAEYRELMADDGAVSTRAVRKFERSKGWRVRPSWISTLCGKIFGS